MTLVANDATKQEELPGNKGREARIPGNGDAEPPAWAVARLNPASGQTSRDDAAATEGRGSFERAVENSSDQGQHCCRCFSRSRHVQAW